MGRGAGSCRDLVCVHYPRRVAHSSRFSLLTHPFLTCSPRHVYFAGNFLRHDNTIAMRTLAYAITFWSNGEVERGIARRCVHNT